MTIKTGRETDMVDWFELWFDDKQSILETMIRNMRSDLDNGYNYFGQSIRKQVAEIDAYKAQFDEEMRGFRTMEESKIQHWCYYDLKRRGAIG